MMDNGMHCYHCLWFRVLRLKYNGTQLVSCAFEFSFFDDTTFYFFLWAPPSIYRHFLAFNFLIWQYFWFYFSVCCPVMSQDFNRFHFSEIFYNRSQNKCYLSSGNLFLWSSSDFYGMCLQRKNKSTINTAYVVVMIVFSFNKIDPKKIRRINIFVGQIFSFFFSFLTE